jgi:hypothetical protein
MIRLYASLAPAYEDLVTWARIVAEMTAELFHVPAELRMPEESLQQLLENPAEKARDIVHQLQQRGVAWREAWEEAPGF